jgi:hypothetical protein
MAAQFADIKLSSVLSIELPVGRYHFTIRQMFDPADEDMNAGFEVIMQPADDAISEEVKRIYWME